MADNTLEDCNIGVKVETKLAQMCSESIVVSELIVHGGLTRGIIDLGLVTFGGATFRLTSREKLVLSSRELVDIQDVVQILHQRHRIFDHSQVARARRSFNLDQGEVSSDQGVSVLLQMFVIRAIF